MLIAQRDSREENKREETEGEKEKKGVENVIY